MRQPREILSGPRPPPPPWPQHTGSPPQSAPGPPLLQRTHSNDPYGSKLSRRLYKLQRGLRSVHKRKIPWPTMESVDVNLTPKEYLDLLLEPLADLFNRLRGSFIGPGPLTYDTFTLDESIYGLSHGPGIGSGVSFSLSFKKIIDDLFYQPNDMFETQDNVSSSLTRVLSQAHEHAPSPPRTIVVTNFRDIAVFFPSSFAPQPSFEQVSSAQFSLALQVISAACIHDALPGFFWVDRPSECEFIPPEGPVQNPDAPLLSDDDLLATHRRHADFDIPTLLRDKARALQFFRWHDHVRRSHSKLVAQPKDVLHAVPHAFNLPLRPLYPFDARELPADTLRHITETQRASGMQASGIADRFVRAKSFLVEIQDIVSAGSEYGICTVYRCTIVSIDNVPVAVSPSLALKLFDDRFQVFREDTQREVEKS
ncbi:hypothetical protein C0992_005679, partial [Termitomyces sp. T32_za158]